MLRIKSSRSKILILFFATVILALAYFANRPNRELHFSRVVSSQLSPERLDRHVAALTRWPQWFHSMAEARLLHHPEKTPPVSLKKGDEIELAFDPKKGPWKKFSLRAKVTEYIPGKELSIEVLEDSSGRLTRLFDRIHWKIEFESSDKSTETHSVGIAKPTLIRGIASAHTKHWKSRLFGSLSEGILMNQVFFPNLFKLADLSHPFSVDDPRARSQALLSP